MVIALVTLGLMVSMIVEISQWLLSSFLPCL